MNSQPNSNSITSWQNKRKRPEGQWSLYFKACIDCGTTGDSGDGQTQHGAKGRCKRCDTKFHRVKYSRLTHERVVADRKRQQLNREALGLEEEHNANDIIIQSNDKLGDGLPCAGCKNVFGRDDRVDTEGMRGEFTVFCKKCYQQALRLF